MSNYKTTLIAAIMGLLGVLVMGSLSPGAAQVVVDCNSGGVLQDAIDAAPSNETILVTGRCNENIRINGLKQKLTIDGQGSARIIAADDNMATVSIFGREITVQNFRVIRGGANGIRLSNSAVALIKNNTIRRASGQGISVEGNSSATITGNRIRRHGVNGISILESSAAEIGTNCTEDDLNVIARNGQSGIALSRKAQASIRGNIIRNNAANGIFVSESSMADTASNIISGNGSDGIAVRLGSSVRLGRRNAPDSCGNNPNSTNPNNLNAGIGIDCQSLSAVDGVLGSLDGADGAADLKDDNGDCPNCCFASVDLDVPPQNEAPEAAFSFETDGLTVDFTDESTDSDGEVVAWSWDFGDGDGTSTEQNPSYTYAEEGTYTVTLTVTDDQDAESEPAEDSVAVSAPPGDGVVQVFVTSEFFQGNLGGLAGADAMCQTAAENAGLTGTWTAWLSTTEVDAKDRIPDGEYRLVNGILVAPSKQRLTATAITPLEFPIIFSESGQLNLPSNVWTGTLPDGTTVPPSVFGSTSNCDNWTSSETDIGCSNGDLNCGNRASNISLSAEWTYLGTPPEPALSQCSTLSALYCFGGGE